MVATVGFPGMRGTGDWETDMRPKNWRQGLLRLEPNGDFPLIALLSKFKEESTDDPEYYWWTKVLQTQDGDVTSLHKNASLLTTSGNIYSFSDAAENVAADAIVYAKCAEATAKHFRIGMVATIQKVNYPDVYMTGKVVQVAHNGASSYVAVKGYAYNPDSPTNASTSTTFSFADSASDEITLAKYQTTTHGKVKIRVSGSVNAEGAEMPTGISYTPQKFYNYTQIFRSPLSITRTAKKTKLRTGEAYQEMKREALQYHGIDMERNFIWGTMTEKTGENGKPERTSRGLLSFIRGEAPGNIVDFRYDVTNNTSWASAGYDWLNERLETVFRYGSSDKFCVCGSGALLGINALAKQHSQITIEPGLKIYGMDVRRWITPFGNIILKTHPLFNEDDAMRNTMLLLEPQNITTRVLDDTFYKEDDRMKKGGVIGKDGVDEEYLTELGWEVHFPQTMSVLYGIGVNSPQNKPA